MSRIIFRDWEASKRKVQARIAGQLVGNMEAVGVFCEGEAQSNAPVWRGILKSDITHTVGAHGDTIEGIVGVKKRTFWAYFVELGTKKMVAQPFLRPAVFGNIKRIFKMLRGE